jgi:LuxR family transcriptional regulator
MYSWRETLLHELMSAADDEQAVLQRTADIARTLGFDYCAYGFRAHRRPMRAPATFLLNNYPKAWQSRYDGERYAEIDPSVKHALETSLPYLWPGDPPSNVPHFWEDARAHGLRVGWAMASRDNFGSVGMLTLARSAEPLTGAELSASEIKWCWLAVSTHEVLSTVLNRKCQPELKQKITARERDVLGWSAAGKTAFEIAVILNVSQRTVNFHIANLLVKLNASNKVEAVVKAATLGLLQ